MQPRKKGLKIMREVRVAMIGYGGIAKSHKKAYEELEKEGVPVKLVAICDINKEQFTSNTETNLGAESGISLEGINLYTDLDEMIAKEDFELTDICLPSYLHREYTVKMLRAGKHVQCEKPMALTAEDCAIMIKTAEEESKRLMVGQCLRYAPHYLYAKKCIDENTFGKVKAVCMERLSALPEWGFENWFQKTECSGGCAMDLHIHDVDMVRFLFGDPVSVSAVAYDKVTKWQYINSRFYYGDEKVITATGSWDEPESKGFSAGFRIRFEKASLVSDSKGLTVYPDEGKPYKPDCGNQNYMTEELRSIATLVADPELQNTVNPPESAMKSVALVTALCKSADNGGEKVDF